MTAEQLKVNDIGVVVVCYQPEGDIDSRIERMSAQGGAVVVVDNASSVKARAQLETACRDRGWELIANAENLGVGTALNQGVRRLTARGFRWVLLFDQDSEPAPDLSQQMIESLRRHPKAEQVAVLGSSFTDANTGRRHRVLMQHSRWTWLFHKAEIAREDFHDVSMVITSGSLLRVADFEALGGFDESFFIDYVDTDFCLRCRSHGRLIAVSAGAPLSHSLGDRGSQRILGYEIQPTNHSPLRHYYIARNRIRMIGRHAWREPHWFLFDCAAGFLWLFRVLAAEKQKRAKVFAMLLGTWDGLRGTRGACSPERLRTLQG